MKLINRFIKRLKNLKILIIKFYGLIWGVMKIGNLYGFFLWMKFLLVGKSMEFVYIYLVVLVNVLVFNYFLE